MPTAPRGDDPEVRRQVLESLVKQGVGEFTKTTPPRPLTRKRDRRTPPMMSKAKKAT